MPGLIGFTCVPEDDHDASHRTIKAMQDLITHFDFHTCDAVTIDDQIAGTRCYSTIDRNIRQPFVGHGFQIWLDGEFYNREELSGTVEKSSRTDLECLASFFRKHIHDESFQFLRRINGIYSAVIYDPQRQKLYLLTDRYGLKHLFWTHRAGRLTWSSEYKAFLALPDFEPRIDEQAVSDFLTDNLFRDDRTWFEEVRLLSSGSVLVWDLKQRSADIVRYWGWDEIQTMTGPIDEPEVVEELGRLFRRAVQRCASEKERIGIHLSGGLDSRAILAAVPERYESIHTFTWGRPGCDDIRLAAQASATRNAVHHVAEINAENWLWDRIHMVWYLDGEMNIFDMHATHTTTRAQQLVDVNLNGFLGGNVVGGEYIGAYPDLDEAEVIETRGRRYIVGGLKIGWLFYMERPVFFENDFMEFAMSIPHSLRRNSYIYNKMLVSTFPAYFDHMAWQRTGCPISWPPWRIRAHTLGRSVRYGLSKRLARVGVNLPDHRAYADYNGWLRREPAQAWISALLFDKNALWPQYISPSRVEALWQRHQAGENLAHPLCRYVTFEIWLRQVFQNELRPLYPLETGPVPPRTSIEESLPKGNP